MKFKLLFFVLLSWILASCSPSNNPAPDSSGGNSQPALPSGMRTIVSSDGSQTKVVGEPFDVPMDNCGNTTTVTQSQEKSRTYRSELDITVSKNVAAEIGGTVEVATAMLREEVGVQLGIRFGTDNTFTSRIEMPIAPGTQTITTLQWKEEWVTGNVTIVRPDGSYVDVLPFSALNDVVLMQVGVKSIDCKSGNILEQPAATAIIETPVLPQIVPAPTPALIGTMVFPGNTSEGVKFTATQPGLYTFKYVNGAYSIYPKSQITSGQKTWLTAFRVFLNRSAEWNGTAITNYPDYNFADFLYFGSSNDAENTAQGYDLTVGLLKGDYLLFVPVDGKPYYSDNPGEVTVDILFTPR